MSFSKKLLDNYNLSFQEYESDYKSDIWTDIFRNFSKKLSDGKFLHNFRSNKKLSLGLDDYGGFFLTLDSLLKLIDICGKEFIDMNLENTIGSPDEVYSIGDRQYNYNDLQNINNLFLIKQNIKTRPKIILEIGAGYACLLAKLKKNYSEAKIVCIDLPEALVLQSYYLYKNFPDKKFFLYEDFKKLDSPKNLDFSTHDFYLLPPWILEDLFLENKIDLIINIDSMMEMRKKIISKYFNFIHKSLSINGIFYNVNKYEKNKSGDIVRISEYPYNKFWKVLYSKVAWLKPNIHTLITQKINFESNELNEILEKLPKTNPNLGFQKKRSFNIPKQIIRKLLNLFFSFIPKKVLMSLFKIYL